MTRSEMVRACTVRRKELEQHLSRIQRTERFAGMVQDAIEKLPYEKSLLHYIDINGYDQLMNDDPTGAFAAIGGLSGMDELFYDLMHGGVSDTDCGCTYDEDVCLSQYQVLRTFFRAIPVTENMQTACSKVFAAIEQTQLDHNRMDDQYHAMGKLETLITYSALWAQLHGLVRKRQRTADEQPV